MKSRPKRKHEPAQRHRLAGTGCVIVGEVAQSHDGSLGLAHAFLDAIANAGADAAHADERGLLFLSSPFSGEAVALLERLGIAAWKVASGEVNNPVLLDQMLRTKKPMLLSSGISSLAELDAPSRASARCTRRSR